MSALTEIIKRIEWDIKAFYKIKHDYSAIDFRMPEPLPNDSSLSKVYVLEIGGDMELGLYLDHSIEEELTRKDPFSSLSNSNLNAYCTLVEELSHFHLILRRALQKRVVTKVELEWQAEVDKMLLSAIRLHEQSSDAHYQHLFRKIFDESKVVVADPIYWDATCYAARFWSQILSYTPGISQPLRSPNLKSTLRASYEADWQGKLDLMSLPSAA